MATFDTPPPANLNAQGVDNNQQQYQRKLVSDQGEKFQDRPKYRDVPFAVLFLIQLIGMVALAIYYGTKEKVEVQSTSFGDHLLPVLVILLVTGITITLVYLAIIRAFARFMIWCTLILSAVALGLAALASFAFGSVTGGFIFLLFFALSLLYIYLVRHRIPFATAMLEIVVDVIKLFPATIYVSVFGTVLQVGWIILWAIGAGFALDDIQSRQEDGSSTANVVYVFLILSMFWTSQVIQNIVHVTVAGTVASWYFLFPQSMPSSPTSKALKRSLTTSFGSICFGSLIVAIVQTLRTLVQAAVQNSNEFVRCCAMCLMNCLERIVEYFNLYAFTQVAIYGKSYCEAAKDTWNLFKSKGFDAIINDDLIGGVLSIGALFGGLVVMGVSILTNRYVYNDVAPNVQAIWAFVGFMIGFILVLCAMVVIRSGVATVFVCFAEDPAALSESKPSVYGHLEGAWNKRYGDQLQCPGAGKY